MNVYKAEINYDSFLARNASDDFNKNSIIVNQFTNVIVYLRNHLVFP